MPKPESRPLTYLIGGAAVTREWVTMVQLAQSGLFPSSEAARKFVAKHKADLVCGRKGRVLLVDRRSLDRCLEQQALKAG